MPTRSQLWTLSNGILLMQLLTQTILSMLYYESVPTDKFFDLRDRYVHFPVIDVLSLSIPYDIMS